MLKSGGILAEDYRAYPMSVRGDRVEQDPEDWWKGAVAVLSSVAGHAEPGSVAAICLSGQMQDLVTLDERGSSGPALLYSDARAWSEAEVVASIIGAEELALRTGNLQDAAGLLAKIFWLRRNEPARYQSARRFLFAAHDYIAWRMTGTEATDYTTLSTTGLLDISANTYAWPMIQALGFEMSLFPSLVRADHDDGGVLAGPARLIGVPEGTPVFHGSGDAGSTTVGAGAGVPGVLSCSLGTSGWLAAASTGGLADPEPAFSTSVTPTRRLSSTWAPCSLRPATWIGQSRQSGPRQIQQTGTSPSPVRLPWQSRGAGAWSTCRTWSESGPRSGIPAHGACLPACPGPPGSPACTGRFSKGSRSP